MDIRDIEEIQQLRDRIHQMKFDHEETLHELREAKLGQNVKSEKLKEALNKLESTDKELMTALTENNRLKKQQSELSLENQKILKKLQRYEDENRRLGDKYEKNEENLIKLQDEHHFMSKKLTGYSKDYSAVNEQYEDSLREISRLRDVERISKIAIDDMKDIFKTMLGHINRFVKKLSPTASQYLLSFDKMSETLRRMDRDPLGESLGYREEKDSNLNVEVAFQDLFGLLINDLEIVLKKHIQIQQDLKLNQQRIFTLEKKCSSLNTEELILKDTERELKREVDSLQEYKANLSKERESLLKERDYLRREQEKNSQELINLRQENSNFRDRVEILGNHNNKLIYEVSQKNIMLESTTNVKEERLKYTLNEKKSLERIIDKIVELIPFDDIRMLSLQIINTQNEIESTEQDRDKIEGRLNNLENDLKGSIKQGQSSEKELYELRKKVENYREDLRNNQTQIKLLREKKESLFDELSNLSLAEKRRTRVATETEKSLITARHQLQSYQRTNDYYFPASGSKEKFSKSFNNKGSISQLPISDYEKENYGSSKKVHTKYASPSQKFEEDSIENNNIYSTRQEKNLDSKKASELSSQYLGTKRGQREVRYSVGSPDKPILLIDEEKSGEKYDFKQILSAKSSKHKKPIMFHNTWEENEKVRKEMEEDRRNVEESLRYTKRNLKNKLEEAKSLFGNYIGSSSKLGTDRTTQRNMENYEKKYSEDNYRD